MSNLENEFFISLAKQALRDSNAGPDDAKASDRFTWALIGILFFVGVEAVKVTFRRNFDRNGINKPRLILCAFCFLGIAAICFYYNSQPDWEASEYGMVNSFIPAAIFYIIAAFFIVAKGMKPTADSFLVKPNHKGDSYLLSFLKKEGWSDNLIKNLAEPILVIAIGTGLSFVNMIWGLPIVFCGLSVWAHQVMGLLFFHKPMEQNLTELQSRQQPENQFYKIS